MKRLILTLITLGLLGCSIGFCQDNEDFTSLLQAARQGNAEAMCDLALVYYHGNGVLKDPFKAKCWVQKAHEKGAQKAEKLWNKLELWQYSGVCGTVFDDEKLPEHQAKDSFQNPVTGMEMIWLPGGCFTMGCKKGNNGKEKCSKEERPAHRVCLDGFWMGAFEVTQRKWKMIMGNNPSRFNYSPAHPVEQISFNEVKEFIVKLNEESGLRFSLPTEAQWEYACQSPGPLGQNEQQDKNSSYPWGQEEFRPRANCGTCDSGQYRGRTAPVGSFPPNEAGLYDMGGNVREWCQDFYDKKAYATHARKNPMYNQEESSRVVRGGSYADNSPQSRCGARQDSTPSMESQYIGFRLVLKNIN